MVLNMMIKVVFVLTPSQYVGTTLKMLIERNCMRRMLLF